ncbi:MAG TPA: cell division protein ZapE [Rhodanobacteraceae bacterium]|nr:cell division protein ZapE [Rhodanobacteraceae bacterium]
MIEAVDAGRGERPSARYRAAVAVGLWQDDPAQRAALGPFDRIWSEFAAAGRARRWQRSWRRLTGNAPRGVYLWGDVGRGKTVLLDLLFDSAPAATAERAHFHRFMQGVHTQLNLLRGQRDPLMAVAARIAARTRLLCLDEFFVSDIGDAMILGNLLQGLFARGVVLVTTSNTPPPGLYRDGLQRERFVPAIAAIERHCDVVELASPHDWRLRALRQAPMYQTPPGADAERIMAGIFARVAHGAERREFPLDVNDRPIAVKHEADGAIWFEFDALCEGPRSVADYIELARAYHTVLISNVPQFTPQTEDAARRFIDLVDEFYDRAVNLVLSAAAPIVELYDGERLRAQFARTQSRLIEMQSEDYLTRAHRA